MAPVTDRTLVRTFGVVHGQAHCDDCTWETQSYKNAQALAAQHAKRYGHKVRGEVGAAYTYEGVPK